MTTIKHVSRAVFALISVLALVACGGGGSSPTPAPTPAPAPSPSPATNAAFIENAGVVIVEMESLNIDGTDWALVDDAAATGGQAIEWLGDDNFNTPGVGIIEIHVQISTPGTYLFTWNNKVGEGTSATEANDSWSRIESDRFYGVRESDGGIVCPKDLDPTKNACTGEEAESGGRTLQGWFKTYRTGGPVGDYHWRTFTSDFDPHEIFADFSEAGTYTVEVAGRSTHHVIDRFALILNGLDREASRVLPESARVGGSMP